MNYLSGKLIFHFILIHPSDVFVVVELLLAALVDNSANIVCSAVSSLEAIGTLMI